LDSAGVGQFWLVSNDLLIGNFGDGTINVFALNGNFLGTLDSNGSPITIEGLWGLALSQHRLSCEQEIKSPVTVPWAGLKSFISVTRPSRRPRVKATTLYSCPR
jgi:hypothetical protein